MAVDYIAQKKIVFSGDFWKALFLLNPVSLTPSKIIVTPSLSTNQSRDHRRSRGKTFVTGLHTFRLAPIPYSGGVHMFRKVYFLFFTFLFLVAFPSSRRAFCRTKGTGAAGRARSAPPEPRPPPLFSPCVSVYLAVAVEHCPHLLGGCPARPPPRHSLHRTRAGWQVSQGYLHLPRRWPPPRVPWRLFRPPSRAE